MKLVLATLLAICLMGTTVSAGEKSRLFSGTVSYLNDDSRTLGVKNHKNRELIFFVPGNVLHDKQTINLVDLSIGTAVTVTYHKKGRRKIAELVTTRHAVRTK